MAGRPRDPGVVLVTVDSLRHDAVDPETAPTLSRLERDGISCEHAFAHGNWTPFSFPPILGPDHVFEDTGGIGLPETPVLAEVLGDDGVETGGFNAANGFLSRYWGYHRGFDEFDAFLGDTSDGVYSKYLAAHPTVQGWLQWGAAGLRRRFWPFGSASKPFVDTSKLIDVERRATDFLDRVEGRFFLWIHYMDTHTPYLPAVKHLDDQTPLDWPRRLKTHLLAGLGRQMGDRSLDQLRSLYRGAVRQVDASIDRLLDHLRSIGRRDETTIIVTGDHGEEFQEHGHLAHYPKLYEELVHVPLIVDTPHRESGSIEEAVGLDTIPPTVMAALGVDRPTHFGGRCLFEPRSSEPVFSVTVRARTPTHQPIPRSTAEGELIVSARTDRWTYIRHTDTGFRELYDRVTDPGETQDRWADLGGSPAVRRIESATETYLRRLEGEESTSDPSVPEAVTGRLSALGYQ